MKTNEWTYEMEANFIDLVKQYEGLWQTKHKNFHKTKYKQLKYGEISRVLNHLYPGCNLFSHDQLLKKFNTMKNYFKKRYIKQALQPENNLIFWEHFERLKFLVESCDGSDEEEEEEEDSNFNVETILYEPESSQSVSKRLKLDTSDTEMTFTIQEDNTFRKKEWTCQMEAKFINLVKRHEDLWQVNSPHFHKTKYKQVKYTEIGRYLAHLYPAHSSLFTHDSLLKKFNNMKNYFKKEYMKQKQHPDDYMVSWEHYDSMKFLEQCFESASEEGKAQNVMSYTPDEVFGLRNCEREISQHFSKKQTIHSPGHTRITNPMESQQSLGSFLGSKLFSIRDKAERHNLLMEVLNMIHAYELRQAERESH